MQNKYRQRGEFFLAGVIAGNTFDSTLDGLQVTGGGPGSLTCKLHVHDRLQNRYGTLHGGCIATLVDVVGSAALVTLSDKGGVSLAINTLYLNPMPGDEEVVIEARVVKLGKDIGTIEVLLRRGSTGDLVATGTHVKKLVGVSDLSEFFKLLQEESETEQQQPQHQQGPGQQQQQQQQKQQKQAPKLRSRL